jgi:hypothetical protein
MLTSPAAFLTGVAILIIVVWDAFEVITPARDRGFRLLPSSSTRISGASEIHRRPSRVKKVRESAFGIFGPISSDPRCRLGC